VGGQSCGTRKRTTSESAVSEALDVINSPKMTHDPSEYFGFQSLSQVCVVAARFPEKIRSYGIAF